MSRMCSRQIRRARGQTAAIVRGVPADTATAAAQLARLAATAWPYSALAWIYGIVIPLKCIGALIMVIFGWRLCRFA